MKHIKLFENFIESDLSSKYSNFSGGPIWHVSSVPIEQLLPNQPLWFALEYDHSLAGWYQNSLDENGSAYLYEAQVSGKLAVQDDPQVTELFEKAGLSIEDDYIVEVLVQNPTAEEVLEADGTKLLQSAGYTGLIYYDYDPRDFNNDLEAIIVFDSANLVGWHLKDSSSNETH